MEDPIEYHRLKILLETPDGSIYSEMKQCGLPLGCFPDAAERYYAFERRLNDSIFKSLEIIEEAIKNYFSIGDGDVIYEVCSGYNQWNRWTKNVTLKQIKEIANKYLNQSGDEDFYLQIVVNCKRQITPNDVQIWGTVINIGYWKEEWYDELVIENYTTWLIAIEGISTVTDEPFSSEKIESIKTSVLNKLKQDYSEFYDDWQKKEQK